MKTDASFNTGKRKMSPPARSDLILVLAEFAIGSMLSWEWLDTITPSAPWEDKFAVGILDFGAVLASRA